MSTTFNGSVAQADFSTRMDTLKQLAQMTGFRLPSTIVPEGESLIPYGEERCRALKDEIYALPTVAEAAERLRIIRAEQRPVDSQVLIADLTMRPDDGGLAGRTCDPAKRALSYTSTAFAQAASFVKPQSVSGGFASTLLALPPKIRADAFNHFAETAVRSDEREVVLRSVLRPQQSGSAVVLRRGLDAVVSTRYTAIEDHDLISGLGVALPDGARVRVTQTEGRSDMEILWPAMSREIKVGDAVLIALHIWNSQNKGYSIRLAPKLLRCLCLNFTTAWSDGGDEEVTIRHMGEAASKFRAALRSALDKIEPFVRAFADAYSQPFPAEAKTRGEIVSRLVRKLELPASFGQTVISSWDMDGTRSAGDTLAGLSNAMTRAAQDQTMERAAVIEDAAGRIVAQGWSALF